MVISSRGSSISSKLRYYLILQAYYFAILIGITSLKFDFKTRKFSNSKYLHLYCNVINIMAVLLAPMVQWHILNNASFYVDNLQMKLINSINLNIRCAAAIMTLVLRWKRERQVRSIIERLIALEEEYFGRVLYPPQLITKFHKLFFLKYASVWLQSLASLYLVYRYVSHMATWWYVTLIYEEIILNILHGVVLHFYICLLHIGSRFYIVNSCLKEIYFALQQTKFWTSLRSQRQMQKALAAEMNCLTYIHRNLMNIVAELNDSYMFQILTILMTHIFNNIAMGYYGVMMCNDLLKFNLSFYDIIIGCLTYCFLALDLYLVDVNCSTVQTSYETTTATLKQFNQFDDMEPSFVRNCEILSLHLMQKKLFINICGMFNLNKKTSFVMFGFTIRQVLILVQNDMGNTRRH